jgi:uncharacterized protein (TIGR02246 family)
MLDAEDMAGIDRVRANLRDAILRGDSEAYAECFTPDAFVMHQDAPFVRGIQAIREHTEQIVQAVTVKKLDLEPVVVAGTDRLAYEVGLQEVAIEPAIDAFKARRKHLHVYERQVDGTWKIAAAMSSND